MPWKYNGNEIKKNKGWVDSQGIQHPSNWDVWSDAEKISKGLVWEDAPTLPEPFDNRFYWGRDENNNLLSKNLDDVVGINSETSVTITDDYGFPVYTYGLKTEYKKQTNIMANSLLQPTDWMIIANTERNRTISTSITNYRAAVVSCATQIKTAIDACTSIGEIVALFDAPTTVVDSVTTTDGRPVIDNWPNPLAKS